VQEPLIPTLKVVRAKYRKGTILGRFVRHFADNGRTRKVFAANLAVFAIATSFMPSTKASDLGQPDQNVVQTTNTFITEKGIQYPLEIIKINQGYGIFHPGLDLGSPVGTPVKPIKEGKVEFAGPRKDGYGNLIIINHGKGLESYYAHLSKIEVLVGQEVKTTQEIGQVGKTGHATGPHLHLEIHQNGLPLNPTTVIAR